MKAANLIARYQERGSTEFLQDVLQMYYGDDEYESSAARSAINEFAQEAVPGVRIQESMDVFAHAAEGKLSDEKIASYYIENRADVNQIVDNEILRLVEAEEMAMVEEELAPRFKAGDKVKLTYSDGSRPSKFLQVWSVGEWDADGGFRRYTLMDPDSRFKQTHNDPSDVYTLELAEEEPKTMSAAERIAAEIQKAVGAL